MTGITKNNVIVFFAAISVACALCAPVLLTGQAAAAEAEPTACTQSVEAVSPQTPGGTAQGNAHKIVLISLVSSVTTLAAIGFLATRRNSSLFPPLA